MKTKQDWKKWLGVMLLVALASFGTTGIAFADHSNQAALVTADFAPCDVTWAGGSALPSNVLAEICFATESDLTAEAAIAPVDFVPNELSWVTEASDIPPEVLDAIRFSSTFKPTESASHSLSYFEAYLEALDLMERELDAAFVSSSISFDGATWNYARALEDHAISEGQ